MSKCRENWRRKRRRAAKNKHRRDSFMDLEIKRMNRQAMLAAYVSMWHGLIPQSPVEVSVDGIKLAEIQWSGVPTISDSRCLINPASA